MIKEFQNPSNRFRPIPFWSWNDELDKEELSFQIAEMKEAGVGGYFMHARSGLKTEYLSEDWFQCIKAGIEAGKKYELDAWIYDEEGWPSGFAGGLIPALSSDYHSKYITMEKFSSIEEICSYVKNDQQEEAKSLKEKITREEELPHTIIALYSYHKINKTFRRIEKVKDITLKASEVILAVKRNVNEFYVDTLNQRAIKAFLEVTHEEYDKRFGKDFGSFMHGFFTDEPRLACDHFGDLAWSDDLPEAFYKKHSYDILDFLPALYFETEGCEKYRYDFWVTVNEMFAVNYMKTIYDWCEAHQCKVTGHIMMEESIFSQMTSTAGVMPFYEYMHIPGIDWLRRMISSPVIAKQVGSVACQLGKKQVLTESFALCGWNVSFEELKWIAEWQFVNGVNQICQHLEAYTIKGSRKRDYPPSLFIQQTWWKEYKKFNDYLGRLCVALSEGDQTADVLLLHPMRSGYVCYDGTRTEAIRVLDQRFEQLSSLLSGLHISYHFGDETIISNYASVKGAEFIVGRIAYKTVILPHMYAIDAKTLELLLEFHQQGGTLLSMGQLPYYTNGDLQKLKKLCETITRIESDKLRTYLMKKKLIALSIEENGEEISDITYLQRETDTSCVFFLVNHNQEKAYHTKVSILGKQGEVVRLIAEDGTQEVLPYQIVGGNTVFELYFEPMQSYILQLLPPSQTEFSLTREETIRVPLKKHWDIEQIDLNSMTLDYCDYRIDGGKWLGRTPVIKLQKILLELQRPCKIELSFSFEVAADLKVNREFYAVIEDAQAYEITVNGVGLTYQEEGWWKDKTFKKVTIKPYLKSGTNHIILKTDFVQPQKVYDVLFGENVYETEKNKITYGIELESIYLLGDFGVVSKAPFERIARQAMITQGEFEIVDAPLSFKDNNFTVGGLLFFAGSLTVTQRFTIKKQEGQRLLLDLQKQNAPFVKVYINDRLVKDSLWAPYTADITDLVVDGENKVSLKLYASNRNLLGPHHHIDGECYNVGPESFTGKWSWVERKSEADATEVIDLDKNYWTDTYSFVDFGLFHE